MSGCKWKAGAGQTIGGIFRWLGVFAPSEPDGVPLMAGGERVGTIAPDGTLILKPGLDYRPLFNGQIQGQTKEPE